MLFDACRCHSSGGCSQCCWHASQDQADPAVDHQQQKSASLALVNIVRQMGKLQIHSLAQACMQPLEKTPIRSDGRDGGHKNSNDKQKACPWQKCMTARPDEINKHNNLVFPHWLCLCPTRPCPHAPQSCAAVLRCHTAQEVMAAHSLSPRRADVPRCCHSILLPKLSHRAAPQEAVSAITCCRLAMLETAGCVLISGARTPHRATDATPSGSSLGLVWSRIAQWRISTPEMD